MHLYIDWVLAVLTEHLLHEREALRGGGLIYFIFELPNMHRCTTEKAVGYLGRGRGIDKEDKAILKFCKRGL